MADVPTLTDGTVVLDALRHDDAPAMVAADDEATRWAWGRDEPLTLDAARSLIAEAAAGWADGSGYWFAIRRTEAPEYIGRLDLWPARGGDGGKIGVIVAPAHRKQGLARAAVELGIRYAFDVLDWPFIVAEIMPDNEDSLRLAESVGFRRWPGELPPTNKGQRVWAYMLHRDGEAFFMPG